MTRDEIFRASAPLMDAMRTDLSAKERADYLLQAFVALGMLKIDEPESAEQRGRSVIGTIAAEALDRHGLKIVEK